MADVDLLLFEIASTLKSTVDSKFPEFDQLKLEQVLSIVQFVIRKDAFAVLPTGFGKSVIFQVIPITCFILAARAACLSGGNIDEKGIEQGDYSFIFTSPESVIRNEKWPKMLRTNVYKERLFGLVTDEAHVIPKCMSFTVYVGYGGVSGKEHFAAFRECFGKLGELRSLFPPLSPVLALTALLQEIGPNTPRTIIYCKQQKECGRLFCHLKLELGGNAYYPLHCVPSSTNMIIGLYHHNTLKKNQDRVLDSLFHESGVCRVVFASTALGMGFNIKDIHMVIHYGPPMLPEVEFSFDLEYGAHYDSEKSSSDGGSAEASLSEMSGVSCL
ncbi:putative ATP-dependent RNA helicase R290 [Acropora cervicornis]|uniref:DNA 3'-5' helicase n=1 Tax=Acropora cervicornis TaxID=6130 RepID=A0AAD9QC98_ACRCE|nr:putative ATP-dependent RNA helicase R290 [Acropora cervicornis]